MLRNTFGVRHLGIVILLLIIANCSDQETSMGKTWIMHPGPQPAALSDLYQANCVISLRLDEGELSIGQANGRDFVTFRSDVVDFPVKASDLYHLHWSSHTRPSWATSSNWNPSWWTNDWLLMSDGHGRLVPASTRSHYYVLPRYLLEPTDVVMSSSVWARPISARLPPLPIRPQIQQAGCNVAALPSERAVP